MVNWQIQFLVQWTILMSLDMEAFVFANQNFQTKAAGMGNKNAVSRYLEIILR